jgi:hypothetical protein
MGFLGSCTEPCKLWYGEKMRTRWIVTAIAVVMIALVVFYGWHRLDAFFVWYRWDSGQNRGYTFGYYGQFNTVGNALSEIPGISVIGVGANHDITLEEFIYKVKTADGKELTLWFMERDPIRKMSGERLTKALLKRSEEELAKSDTLGEKK